MDNLKIQTLTNQQTIIRRFAQDIKQKAYNTPFKWVSIPNCFQVDNTVAPITSPSGPDNGDGKSLALAAASFLKIYNTVSKTNAVKKRTHLNKYIRRLSAAYSPLPIDDNNGHACDPFITNIVAHRVHLFLQLVGFKECRSLLIL
jgi:hypothetical protein